jgi:tRNA(adenine34) deaminase
MPSRADAAGRRSAREDARLDETHQRFMHLALDEARAARHLGEVPIGAVLVREGQVVATGFNQPIRAVDPTAHAEVVALRRAARALDNYRLVGSTLYVTVEPCLMCAGAILNARVGTLVYGVAEPKTGALRSVLDLGQVPANHRLEVVSGVLQVECRALLQEFFEFRREQG